MWLNKSRHVHKPVILKAKELALLYWRISIYSSMLLFKSRKGNNTLNKWNVIIKLYSNNKSNNNYLRGLYIHRLCARILVVISNNSHRKTWWLRRSRVHLQWRRPGSAPGLGRPPGEGNGNPLQHSRLEKPKDRGAWRAAVCGVTNLQTGLSV